ncbi:tRNAHis guanylyltransferase-domain-containing protein [Mycena belliarum]|uniref:tRNA(His) guanylyltransferase n=1 Tax=Mycena belliarum TaxID=1033014 RepID=A0AAD6XJH9_9AGAR|nr:tRNAHis guanylyltransferase-domain-containing protein [Mycena belliae]
MAGSRYAYVRNFELPDPLLPETFMVLRLDGHSFHRFSDEHQFTKPNDTRALALMDHAAKDLMEQYPDIVLAFGESDEFSFLLRKSASLYNRRASKIISTLTSLFTSSYVFRWASYFPDTPLKYPPAFDGRLVLYPSAREIRDYFSWRQTDSSSLQPITAEIAHCGASPHQQLVQHNVLGLGATRRGKHNPGARHTQGAYVVRPIGKQTRLALVQGTVSKEKHEILFARFQVNYNHLDARCRKGSTLVRQQIEDGEKLTSMSGPDTESAPRLRGRTKPRAQIVVLHCDLIKDEFWDARPEILSG